MQIIVTYGEFYAPIESAIIKLGANPALVLAALNEQLVASRVHEKSCTAGIKVSHNTKGECTIRTKDGRVAKRAATPLTRLAQINDWAIEGGKQFVGMELELPLQVQEHLRAKVYREEAEQKPEEKPAETPAGNE